MIIPIIQKVDNQKVDNLCKCKKEVSKEMHPCPFKSDVYDNDKELCNCCEKCVNECCMDI